MCVITNFTRVLSDHNNQYHLIAALHRLAFLGLWFAESFRVLNVFSFVFDSVNSVVDAAPD